MSADRIVMRRKSGLRIYRLTATADVGFDCAHGFVVIAHDEQEARELAQKNGGDETGVLSSERGSHPFWTDPAKSRCRHIGAPLRSITTPEVVLRDFLAG